MDKLTLNKVNQGKFLHNALVFLAPVLILYLTTVVGTISPNGHVFGLMDFVPSTFTQGGITLWFLNTALDYLRKLRA